MIFFSKSALERAILGYVENFHQERNLQGLGNRLVEPPMEIQGRVGRIKYDKRFGGLLKFYCRRAA